MTFNNDENTEPNPVDEDSLDPNQQQTLFFEASPYGTIDAIVQHDGHSVYFYLNGPAPFGTRACWVRNLQAGPYVLDDDAMQQGQTPMLPRTHCTDPAAQPLPQRESLHVIWLEEGNGAALLENSQPIAFIPPWSGIDGFHGYAVECAAESPICWPMPPKEQMHQRFARAAEFWLSFEDETDNAFKQLQSRLLTTFDARFGNHRPGSYFSLDGGRFPPRGLSVYNNPDGIVATTIGMSLCPQPNVELHSESPSDFRRVELGIQLETNQDASEFQAVWQALSGLVAYPWQRLTWLGAGHTIPLEAFAALLGDPYRYALLLSDQSQSEPVDLPPFRGDPTNLLWLVPLTEKERSSLESGTLVPADFETKTRIKI
jgi:hypothetical protein